MKEIQERDLRASMEYVLEILELEAFTDAI
jgi:hypothetical protein